MRQKATHDGAWVLPPDTRFRRRMFHVRHLLICALLLRRNFHLAALGDKALGCQWTFCPDGLGSDSIVYSGGVGNDISFEQGLARQYKCQVHLLDPSPTGLATMNLEANRIPQFHFCPVALTDHNGTLRFAPPICAEEGSWYSSAESPSSVEVPCTDLSTLMKQSGHARIDLLKLDIEGAEYAVIDDVLRKRILVKQLLVEFHDGLLPGIRLRHSLRALLRLTMRGYKLVARVGTNHSFVKPEGSALGRSPATAPE